MPAYVVALIEAITDTDAYKRYVAQVEDTLTPFRGRFLARQPAPQRLEGELAPSRAIILEFPDEAAARAWHASPAYQPVAQLRQSASRGTLLLLPPYPPSLAVREGDVCYVEHVTPDVVATRALLETHGWRFAPPDAALGGALVATLPGGARCAVRAPMHDAERPVTRAYVRVQDVEASAARAQKLGALLAVPPMPVDPHGTIAIAILGGVEHGFWQLP